MRVISGVAALLLAAGCAKGTVVAIADTGPHKDANGTVNGETRATDLVFIGWGESREEKEEENVEVFNVEVVAAELTDDLADRSRPFWDEIDEFDEIPVVDVDLVEMSHFAELKDFTEGEDFAEVKDFGEVKDFAEVEETKETFEVTEVKDVKPDEVCVPNCKGKECGPDGCGGVCGYCAYGQLCSLEGKCHANSCQTQCVAVVGGKEVVKECGPDGCGGYCGYCVVEGQKCGTDGFCYDAACQPDCAKKNKECGPDGCGESCGFCEPGEWCNEQFKCVPHPCGDVPSFGRCEENDILVECIDMTLTETDCKKFEETPMCGWDEEKGKFACVPPKPCQPNCKFPDQSDKECGPDGCSGVCGVCPTGWGCFAGLCKPAEGATCGYIDSSGHCIGNVRWFCSSGKLYDQDCTAIGKKCTWNKDTKAVECL